MQSADSVFAGSMPALYDRYLGPALFEPYAVDLAGRLGGLTAGSLLEVAAGTGRAVVGGGIGAAAGAVGRSSVAGVTCPPNRRRIVSASA